MQAATFVQPRKGEPVLLVGTMKGAFLLSASAKRERWEVSGPHFPGRLVYALAFDGRAGRQRVWASAMHPFFGTMLHSSDDFGRNWTEPPSAPVKFPEDTGQSLKQIGRSPSAALMSRVRCTAAWSRRPCLNRAMRARAGR